MGLGNEGIIGVEGDTVEEVCSGAVESEEVAKKAY